MARRRVAARREALPDPKFNSITVAKFISVTMIGGKKSTAEGIVYGALELVGRKFPNEDPLTIFNHAIDNAKPFLQVKSRRVGGATYQVPVEIAPAQRTAIAFRWIISYARQRNEKTMQERLAAEFLDCYQKQGNTIKKKDDTHRMAEANKAFAHFRF